jgi:hypothetical protein
MRINNKLGVSMDPAKVVVRYLDGKIIKGYTLDFFPNKDQFHLQSQEKSAGQEPQKIMVKDLKAIFFVKNFEGDPAYSERRNFSEADRAQGRKIEVVFKDGEQLVGSTMGYDRSRQGFFIMPVDMQGNNERVYVVQSSIDTVKFI